MRSILLLITLFQFVLAGASDTVQLRTVSYNQVFELAKQEGKHVMLYFHFDGCGACMKMEKTAFADQETARFYNEKFVSLDINTRKGEGIETNKIYGVQMHPTFLFLDTDGNVLHKIVGVFSPEDFVSQAKDALSGSSGYTKMKKEYGAGNRSGQFLYDYAYLMRDAYELDTIVINEYLRTQHNDDLRSEKNIRFIYEFIYHEHVPSIGYTSPAFQLMNDHPDLFTKYFDEEQVKTRTLHILSTQLYDCIEAKDEHCFNMLLEEISPYEREKYYEYKEMDGRLTSVLFGDKIILHAKMDYYKKAGKLKEYDETLMGYVQSIWNNGDQLNSLAWDYYETQDNEVDLKKAISWVKRSIELDKNYFNMDTYAALLYKTGQLKEAKKTAKAAIKLAKEKGEDYEATSELITLINNARNRKG